MVKTSDSTISIGADGLTIEANFVAPKLGLTPESLMSELREGHVRGVIETGAGEDMGRTRVTFTYRSRIWTVVVEPDGTIVETSRGSNLEKTQ